MKTLLLIPTLLFALGAPLARAEVSSLRCELDLQGNGLQITRGNEISYPDPIVMKKKDGEGYSVYSATGIGKSVGLEIDATVTISEDKRHGTYNFTYSVTNRQSPRVSIGDTILSAHMNNLHAPPMDLFRGKKYFLVQLQCVPKNWPEAQSGAEQENEPEQTTSAQ